MRNNAVRVKGEVAYVDLAVPVTIAELERQLTEAEKRGARRVEFLGEMPAATGKADEPDLPDVGCASEMN